MTIYAKLGLLVLISSLFTVGTVDAVSEWAYGDTVQLIVTTTNRGDVDVIRSTGTITISDPRGIIYPCDDFDVEGVVHPGEAVKVPVNWDTSTHLANATWVPGYYDIILEGELAFANGEYETTHSVVEDAFMMYLPSIGLRELPEITYEADVTGITQLTNTYYPGSPFAIFVWINNTGSGLFVPEIQVSFSCGDEYSFEPESQCYYDDVCEPGSNSYMYQCQLPEDMPTGTCEYDVDLHMHYLEVKITDDNYPDGLAGFWHDNYVLSEVGSEEEDEWYRFELGDEQAYILQENQGDCVGFYEIGLYLDELDIWPEPDLGKGYCYQRNIVELELTPDDASVMCGESEEYQAMGSYVNEEAFPTNTHPDISWTTFSDEEYHDILLEVRERNFDYNVTQAWVQGSDYTPGDVFSLWVFIDNNGAYAFEAEFSIDVNEDLGFEPFIIVDPIQIIEPWPRLYELEVEVSDDAARAEEYTCTLDTAAIELYHFDLGDTIPDFFIHSEIFQENGLDKYWLFYLEEGFSEGNHSKDLDLMVVQLDLDGTDRETDVIDEFTNSLSGEGEPASIRILDETDTSEIDYITADDTTDGTEETDETNTENEPSSGETQETSPSNIIQSLIDSIMNFFKNLFG